MKKQTVRRVVLWGVIGILLIAVVYVTFFNGSVSSASADSVKTAGQIAAQYSGMVGNC